MSFCCLYKYATLEAVDPFPFAKAVSHFVSHHTGMTGVKWRIPDPATCPLQVNALPLLRMRVSCGPFDGRHLLVNDETSGCLIWPVEDRVPISEDSASM